VAKKGLSIELSTIVFTAFAVFLWTAIFTYNSQDPSFFTESTQPVMNACGQVGAYLAAVFLQFFGLATFLIPVGFLFVAAHSHSKDGIARAFSSLAGMSVSVIALTIFFSIHWHGWHWSHTEFLTGGVFGTYLSVPLERFANRTGASILSLAIFFVALVISTPIGVSHFLSNFIHASGIVLFRLSRLIATYFAYYSAIGLNKLAQFIGIQAKKSFEQIRERADAYRLARIQARSALTHQNEDGTIVVTGSTKGATAENHSGPETNKKKKSKN